MDLTLKDRDLAIADGVIKNESLHSFAYVGFYFYLKRSVTKIQSFRVGILLREAV